MFGFKIKFFPKKFIVTSVKRVKGNGNQITKVVWSRTSSGAAMKAEPAGSTKIVKVTPYHIDEHDDYMVVHYMATDAKNNSFTVLVEEKFR